MNYFLVEFRDGCTGGSTRLCLALLRNFRSFLLLSGLRLSLSLPLEFGYIGLSQIICLLNGLRFVRLPLLINRLADTLGNAVPFLRDPAIGSSPVCAVLGRVIGNGGTMSVSEGLVRGDFGRFENRRRVVNQWSFGGFGLPRDRVR